MQNQEKIKIDVSSAPWISCGCGGKTFTSLMMFKKLSALLSPTAREETIPVELVICDSCKRVPEFMSSQIPDLPDELKPVKKILFDGQTLSS